MTDLLYQPHRWIFRRQILTVWSLWSGVLQLSIVTATAASRILSGSGVVWWVGPATTSALGGWWPHRCVSIHPHLCINLGKRWNCSLERGHPRGTGWSVVGAEVPSFKRFATRQSPTRTVAVFRGAKGVLPPWILIACSFRFWAERWILNSTYRKPNK